MNPEKTKRLVEITRMFLPFCESYLDDELTDFVLKLRDTLGRKRTLNICSGRPEIWAAALVVVIARLNFLFDKDNPQYMTLDTICDFFDTKKSTVGQKATRIEEACKLHIGEPGYCRQEITDQFTFYETSDGFILPKSIVEKMPISVEFMDEEESREFEKKLEEQRLDPLLVGWGLPHQRPFVQRRVA